MFDSHALWLSLHHGREYIMPRPLNPPPRAPRSRRALRISIGPVHLSLTLGAPLSAVSDRSAG